MIKKTDTLVFRLSRRGLDGELISQAFTSFATASGAAEALKGSHNPMLLNVYATSPSNEFSFSSTTHIYKNGVRRIVNKHLIETLLELGMI